MYDYSVFYVHKTTPNRKGNMDSRSALICVWLSDNIPQLRCLWLPLWRYAIARDIRRETT